MYSLYKKVFLLDLINFLSGNSNFYDNLSVFCVKTQYQTFLLALNTKTRNSFHLSRKERIKVIVNFKEALIMSLKKNLIMSLKKQWHQMTNMRSCQPYLSLYLSFYNCFSLQDRNYYYNLFTDGGN